METDKRIYAVWLAMVLGTKIDSVNVLYGACGDAEEIYRRDDYSDIADLNPRAAKALLSKKLENASAVVAQRRADYGAGCRHAGEARVCDTRTCGERNQRRYE